MRYYHIWCGRWCSNSALGSPADSSAICQARDYQRKSREGDKLVSSILKKLHLGPPKDLQVQHVVDRQTELFRNLDIGLLIGIDLEIIASVL